MPDTEELKAVNSAVRKYATEGDDEYENRDLIDALYSLHDNINREADLPRFYGTFEGVNF